MKSKIAIILLGLALGGCSIAQIQAQLSDPTTVIAEAETAYAGAVASEIVYLNSGKAAPATVKAIEGYRVSAHNVLEPLMTEIAAGNPPTSDQALAVQTAVNALTAYLTANNIGSK